MVREHMASISVANGMPYEREPIQMLACHHEPLSILEGSEQAFNMWVTTALHTYTTVMGWT